MVTAIAGCAGSGSRAAPGPEKADLVVAAVPSESAAGLYIAQAEGLFARAGLHVTIRDSASSSDVIPAMLSGEVDIASGQYTTYMIASASGVPGQRMRILAAGMSLGPGVQEVLAPEGTKMRNLGDLKGKKVAVNVTSGITEDLLYKALATYGITPAQVRLVGIPFQDMPNALVTGQVDAIYEVEPYVTESTYQYGFQVLADLDAGSAQGFPIAGYGVLASWAARYPRTAAAFAAAISQANAVAATNLSVLQRTMTSQLNLDPAVADVMAPGTFPTTVNAVQLQRVADLLRLYGQLPRQFDVKRILGA